MRILATCILTAVCSGCASVPKVAAPHSTPCSSAPLTARNGAVVQPVQQVASFSTFDVLLVGRVAVDSHGAARLSWVSAASDETPCKKNDEIEVRTVDSSSTSDTRQQTATSPGATAETPGVHAFCQRIHMTPSVQRVEIWYAGRRVQSLTRPEEKPRIEVRASHENQVLLSVAYDEFELPFALATAHARPWPNQSNEVCDLTRLSQRSSSGVWPFTRDRCWNNVDHQAMLDNPTTLAVYGRYQFTGHPSYLVVDGLFFRYTYRLPFDASCGWLSEIPVPLPAEARE